MAPTHGFSQLIREGRKFCRGHFWETVVVDDCSTIYLAAPDNIAGRRLTDMFTADAVCQVRRDVERRS